MFLLCTGGTDQRSVETIIYVNTTARIHVQKILNIGQFQIQSCSQFCYYCPIPFQPILYFNGVWISDSRVVYTVQYGTLMLNVSNATSRDLGVYEVVLEFCSGIPLLFTCLSSYFWEVIGFLQSPHAIQQIFIQQYGKTAFISAILFTVPYSSTSGLPTSCTITSQS